MSEDTESLAHGLKTRSMRVRMESVATRVIKSNKRNAAKWACVIITILSGVMVASMVVVFTRPLHTAAVPSHKGESVLLDSAGNTVSTTHQLFDVPLVNLPLVEDDSYYNQMGFVTFASRGKKISEMVTAWTHHSAERMVLRTGQGSTVLLDNAQLAVLPGTASGRLHFDITGSVYSVGSARNVSEAAIADVRAICATAGCPLASCTAATAMATIPAGQVNVREIECAGGVSLWAWPDGVSLSHSGWRMEECNEDVLEHDTVVYFTKCNLVQYPDWIKEALDEEDSGCADAYERRCSVQSSTGSPSPPTGGHLGALSAAAYI